MEQENQFESRPTAGAKVPAPDLSRPGLPRELAQLEPHIRRIEAQFALVLPQPARVREACSALSDQLADPALAAAADGAVTQLATLLRNESDDSANILFEMLEERLLITVDPTDLAGELLRAREVTLRRRAVVAVLQRWTVDDLQLSDELLDRLAAALQTVLPATDLSNEDDVVLEQAGELLRRRSPDSVIDDTLETWLHHDRSDAVRRLAARILDRDTQTVPTARLIRVLGPEVTDVLGGLFAYTRVNHRDLIDLTPHGAVSNFVLTEFATTLDVLGPTAFGAVIGELGWQAVACGVTVERWIGLKVDDGFPFAVSPADADRLQGGARSRRVWDKLLVVAHGRPAATDTEPVTETASVQHFRRYNLLHAELLGEILEVAPVTPAKVRRILGHLDEIVGHFVSLFADYTEDARHLNERYAALREPVDAGIEGVAEDQPLGAELTRLVQMFEDPRDLDEVRTLHGLKRYLHQRGLKLAFRRFRSGRAANRTVDLAVVAEDRVITTLRKIRFIDFEPQSQADGIPFFPALVVEALGRRLLHGFNDAPDLEILIYGNEVQTFVSFRNHPAFLRIDFSPPLRGGMIDLEFFGVSQYELEHHPDLSLPWIQRIFRRLDFDANADGLRLHIRYDKERAFDFGDLTRGVRILCCLLPHLMEVDWVLGGLRYPEPAKAAVADRWADWIVDWGVLPLSDLLTEDRRAIVQTISDGPAGPVEIPWDGRGQVEERFIGEPPRTFRQRLRDVTDRSELDLHRAADRPLRMAALLTGAGESLSRATRLASVVTSVERHLRFATIGAVQDYPVQQASLLLPGEVLDIVVMRDASGLARLALANERPFLLTPGPPPCGGETWSAGRDLDATDLAIRLRRDNYVGTNYDVSDAAEQSEIAAVLAAFALANPLATPTPHPGDRTLAGVVAAPGKAAGIAVFARPDLTAEDVDGCVLFAPALRPEDSPLLRRAAAIVSTGGGILSHAGLIAQELGKPALVVEGRWHQGETSRPALACHTTDYVEAERRVGDYRVTLRRDQRDREEMLQEGDLVVVDAELGYLAVLGQDRDALALQEELRHLDAIADAMARVQEGPQRLMLRGQLLRTTHQLGKLLARLDQPALARHAARELLRDSRPAAIAVGEAVADTVGRHGLLQRLFENPHCGAAAAEAGIREASLLEQRLVSLCEGSLQALAQAETVHEVLFLRRGVEHLRRSLRDARRALVEAGADIGDRVDVGCADLDRSARQRLQWLRTRFEHNLELAASESDAGPRVRSSLIVLAALDDVLDRSPSRPESLAIRDRAQAAVMAHEQQARARLAGQTILTAVDGGLELVSLIGAKGAGLGEIARILDDTVVPPWFAVSDAAFRQVLVAEIGHVETSLDMVPGTPLLLAIAQVLERRDLAPRAQAMAIRAFWQSVAIPVEMANEIREAYHALADDAAAPDEQDQTFVAIRSSSFEEDTSRCSWAGQFDTFLCVRGDDAVLKHLKLAWASLWSERVLLYRQALAEQDPVASSSLLPESVLTAGPGGGVLIQRIVDSRAAGVLHTLAAASGQPREMVLNVGLGFGEGVVSGTVEVDQIVVSRVADIHEDSLRFRYTVGDKRTRVVFDRRAGRGTRREETLYHQRLRPALEYTDLCEIVRAAARLETAYGHPLDIEFAFEQDRLYVLQARPIVAFQNALRDATNARGESHPDTRPAPTSAGLEN